MQRLKMCKLEYKSTGFFLGNELPIVESLIIYYFEIPIVNIFVLVYYKCYLLIFIVKFFFIVFLILLFYYI